MLQVVAEELAVALHRLARDEDGVDVRGVGEHDRGRDRVDERRDVDHVGAQQNHVRLLPRRQRAHLRVEAARARALDRREPQHVTVRQRGCERLVGGVRERLDPLEDERRAHLREHLARDARDDVDGERGAHAALEQPARRRAAVAHEQLDVGGDRGAPAGLRDQVELLVRRVCAVDVGRVRAHDPRLVQTEDVVHVDVRQAHANMDGDPDPELAREAPVVLRRLRGDVADRAGGHGERQQLIVGREVALADPPDVVGMRPVAVRPPAVVAGNAVGVHAPDARVLEAVNRLV